MLMKPILATLAAAFLLALAAVSPASAAEKATFEYVNGPDYFTPIDVTDGFMFRAFGSGPHGPTQPTGVGPGTISFMAVEDSWYGTFYYMKGTSTPLEAKLVLSKPDGSPDVTYRFKGMFLVRLDYPHNELVGMTFTCQSVEVVRPRTSHPPLQPLRPTPH